MVEGYSDDGQSLQRCSNCDSVIPLGAALCVMCGQPIEPSSEPEEVVREPIEPSSDPMKVDEQPAGLSSATVELIGEPLEGTEVPEDTIVEPELVSTPSSSAASNTVIPYEMKERISPITYLLTAGFAVIIITIGILVLMYPADLAIELVPTSTPVPDLLSEALIPEMQPTSSPTPTDTPVPLPTEAPTETPRPPQSHTVSAGETLFGISLRYGVSMESIADASGIPADSALQVSQQLLVPWPTPTPPLIAIEVEISGEIVIADPTGCEIYEIQRGDTLFGIAASFSIPSEAMLQVNRLSEVSVLQPGDTICIPTIVFGSDLPPTPGPSPTPGPTLPPIGPLLLYPPANSLLDASAGTPAFQWLAVKNLEDDEWYMIEMTNLSAVDSHPKRAFTRQTSFQVPESWEPDQPQDHDIRWVVRIVRVTGQRDDGSFIYSFGGESSEDAFFTWRIG